MKKIILSCLSILLFANIANAMNDIESLKSYVSDELNSTVSILKNYFKKTDTDLKEKKVIVEDAKLKAEVLKASSSEKETNPVVLNQGLVAMPNCDTETQELAWNNDKWVCRTPTYGTDCYPAKDETRIDNGDGSFSCVKNGTYTNVSRGLSVCNGTEKTIQIACMFKNTKSGQETEVESGCGNFVQRYKQPCGANGASSSCKCPSGGAYTPSGCVIYGDPGVSIVSSNGSYRHRYDTGWGAYALETKSKNWSYSNNSNRIVVSSGGLPSGFKNPQGIVVNGTIQQTNDWTEYYGTKNACNRANNSFKFNINDISKVGMFTLRPNYDDYMWVFVNGVMVHRTSSPRGSLNTYELYFSGKNYDVCENSARNCNGNCSNIDIKKYLKNGINTIETHLVWGGGGSGGFSLDFLSNTEHCPSGYIKQGSNCIGPLPTCAM
jgi:hypothetical protein